MPKPDAQWLILVYANGNNDLEPEIYQSIKTVLATTWPEDVKIIIQLARAPQKLVQALRTVPPTHQTNVMENWTGVQRYITKKYGSVLPPIDYGALNMADPATLYDFLFWGLEFYPSATHVMVIISGHGGGFVGMMPDFTVGYPQIMSLTGLAEAFSLLKRQTNRQVDVLMLDSCHMNMLEVWFEFALLPQEPVSYLLVPAGRNPLEGLPYPQLIQTMYQAYNEAETLKEQLVDLTTTINHTTPRHDGLILVDLYSQHFDQLKQAFNQLALALAKYNRRPARLLKKLFQTQTGSPLINLLDFCNTLAASVPPAADKRNLLNKNLLPKSATPIAQDNGRW